MTVRGAVASAAAGPSKGAALRVAGLWAAALLVGAGGLGIEALCLSTAGVALGYGRPVALGLAVWLASWAIGAYTFGRSAGPDRLRLLRAAWLAGAAAVAGYRLALFAGQGPMPIELASALALASIALAGFFQGAFLPPLASALAAMAPRLGVGWLFFFNLGGSVLGAQLIGHEAVAAWGRGPASWIAAGASLAGGLLGAASAGALGARRPDVAPGRPPASLDDDRPAISRRVAGWTVGCVTAHMVALEWIGLRYSTLWLGGMQTTLTAVLVASLVALAVGAAILPPLLPRDRRALLPLLGLISLASLWPFAASTALEYLDRGAAPELRALVLVGPMLLPFGAWVPVVHRAVTGESGERLGGLLLHEAWGAMAGVCLAHFVVVPLWGLGGGVAVSLSWCALAVLALGRPSEAAGVAWGKCCALLCIAGVAWIAARAQPPVLGSPALENPAFRRLAFEEDEHFAVTVVEDGVRAERTLLTDSFRATAVGDDYLYMQVLGHLPLLLHPDPERVAVLAFGTGTTAGAVSLHSRVDHIEVLEISRAVCRMAPFFEEVNHGVFAEGLPALLDASDGARVRLRLGDGRRTLRTCPERFDVITMEPLLPNSPFAVYLYTEEFYGVARRALRPGGLVCQWVPPHALAPDLFDAVLDAFARSFPWSGVFLFGTQVVLLGADELPQLEDARFDPADVELASTLEGLGLSTPAGCAARFVTSGDAWPRGPRRLRDSDPWIVYPQPAPGAARLLDLPRNLAHLRRREVPLPAPWARAVGDPGLEHLAALRLLHRAREVRALQRAARFGRHPEIPSDPALASLEDYRAALEARIPDDPERLQLERALTFDAARDAGILALSQGQPRAALTPLLDAVDQRPRCADLYLFLAVALQRTGDHEHARDAIERAIELCPRVLETQQGQAALRFGLLVEG
ncbi:MAG: spermidine synthase [Chlamydiales bacterium]